LWLILSIFPAVEGQNKYILPDPYSAWDGVTHWSKYLIISPAYMGPNALPVPTVRTAEIPVKWKWRSMYEYFYTGGGATHDFLQEFTVPLAGGRAAVEVSYTPVEFFSVDSVLSRTRRTFHGRAAKGYSLGDVYFGTTVRLLKEHSFWPDITFSMTCRTASGTGREEARHTDTPGYYLDLALGKTYGTGRGYLEHLRIFGEAGIYIWQTYLDNNPQNDALLYGVGTRFVFKDFAFQQSIRGYSGYMHNGDHPLVVSSTLDLRIRGVSIQFGYEKGLRDYPFSSIRTGVVIHPDYDQ